MYWVLVDHLVAEAVLIWPLPCTLKSVSLVPINHMYDLRFGIERSLDIGVSLGEAVIQPVS